MGDVNPEYYDRLLLDAKKNDFGMIIYIPFSTASLAIEKSISLWLTDIPQDWNTVFNIGNNDLATLLALLICKNWKGTIDVFIIDNETPSMFTEHDVDDFQTMIRFPVNTTIHVKQGELIDNTKLYRNSDVNIFGIEPGMSTAEMIQIVNESRISAVFCLDSLTENVLV